MRLKTFIASAVVACTGLAAFAGAAQAEQLKFTFDAGRANLGSQQGVELIAPGDPAATITASYTPGTGAFSAPSSGLFVPTKALDDIQTGPPLNLTLDATAQFIGVSNITGNYNQTTGVLDTTQMDVKAIVSVYPDDAPQTDDNLLVRCEISPVPLPLDSTGQIVDQNETPGDNTDDITYAGAPFVPAPGAGVATWASLPASTQTGGVAPFCSQVDGLVAGAGGIWLESSTVPQVTADPVTPTPPATTPPATTPAPKAKKCKKGFKKKGKKCVKAKKKKKKK